MCDLCFHKIWNLRVTTHIVSRTQEILHNCLWIFALTWILSPIYPTHFLGSSLCTWMPIEAATWFYSARVIFVDNFNKVAHNIFPHKSHVSRCFLGSWMRHWFTIDYIYIQGWWQCGGCLSLSTLSNDTSEVVLLSSLPLLIREANNNMVTTPQGRSPIIIPWRFQQEVSLLRDSRAHRTYYKFSMTISMNIHVD